MSECVRKGRLVCPDDLCHGVDETVCCLVAGIDFCDGLCPDTCPSGDCEPAEDFA